MAASYSNIGVLYLSMREYSKSLSYREKRLEIHQKIHRPNHPDLATSCSAIEVVYYNMG